MAEKTTKYMRFMDILVAGVLVIGGLNWGLVGMFGFDAVAAIFGSMTPITRILYCVAGLGALYQVFQFKAISRRWECKVMPHIAESLSR